MREGDSATNARRDELMLPIWMRWRCAGHPIVARDARTSVELGTSDGFSKFYLAGAAARTDCTVHSVERTSDKQAHARDRI